MITICTLKLVALSTPRCGAVVLMPLLDKEHDVKHEHFYIIDDYLKFSVSI